VQDDDGPGDRRQPSPPPAAGSTATSTVHAQPTTELRGTPHLHRQGSGHKVVHSIHRTDDDDEYLVLLIILLRPWGRAAAGPRGSWQSCPEDHKSGRFEVS